MNSLTLKILGLVVIAGAVYLSLFFVVIPRLHDATLNSFAENLFSVSLPASIKETDKLSVVGQQLGNGDHCDYLAATLIESNLSKKDVMDFFTKNYRGPSTIKFVWLDEKNPYTQNNPDPQIIYSLRDWLTNNPNKNSAKVAVYIFETGMTSSFDYRCS